jgi:hypothetical protein
MNGKFFVGIKLFLPIILLLVLGGCNTRRITHTARSGVEEMLLSSAIDKALTKYEPTDINNKKIYIDSSNLFTIKDTGINGYMIGMLRSCLGSKGAIIVEKKEKAEIVLEIYNGTVGTDYDDIFVGIPPIGIPIIFAGTLMSPRITFYEKSIQTGTCKILINLYNIKSDKQIITMQNVLGQTYFTKHALFGFSWKYTDIYNDENRIITNMYDF